MHNLNTYSIVALSKIDFDRVRAHYPKMRHFESFKIKVFEKQ